MQYFGSTSHKLLKLRFLLRVVTAIALFAAVESSSAQETNLPNDLIRFAYDYCVDCHNPDNKKGKFDFKSILSQDLSEHKEAWETVSWMLREKEMPPLDETDVKRPEAHEYTAFSNWLNRALLVLNQSGKDIQPNPTRLSLVDQYCVGCHNDVDKKGELDLDSIRFEEVSRHPQTWEKVLKRLTARQMPPPGRNRPDEAFYQAVIQSVASDLDAQAIRHPRPGRVQTFRRLTRTEYGHAVRDLLGVHIHAADLLPKDEESHGFDNVTVSALSPSLLDRLITAAQKISRLAVGRRLEKVDAVTFRIAPDVTQEKHVEGLPLGTRGGGLFDYTFPQDGEYEITVLLARDRNEHVEGLNGSHLMDILIDQALIERFPVQRKGHASHSEVDKHLKTRTFVKAGPRRVGVTFLQQSFSLLENKRQPFEAHYNLHRHPRLSPAVYQVSITGPYDPVGAESTPSRKQIFIDYPKHKNEETLIAEKILTKMTRLAYRRPVTRADLIKPMQFYSQSAAESGFEAGIESAITSILVNPEFLFRIEKEPVDPPEGHAYHVSDIELASRLSFFLWSSIPDQELLDAAVRGHLSAPQELGYQVARMLKDPRSESLATNFAGQWLHLRNLDSITPDLRLFPDFDDNLRQAFRMETELFVESIIREDRSILDLLKADHAFLNERLARHYDIPGIFGSRFRRVKLDPDRDRRGGLLRQGSILTVTSYATRTSPVIRGNWILENILGTPAPPPPPNVPALEENKVDANLPMRDRLAAHRANPACASCHNLMDPVGFSLENFDAVGRWRDYENGVEIDNSGGLPDGSEFSGVDDLEKNLLSRPELFAATLTEKLMTFALGRGMEWSDAPAIRQIIRKAEVDDFRFSSIISAITQSVPFQMRMKSAGADEVDEEPIDKTTP